MDAESCEGLRSCFPDSNQLEDGVFSCSHSLVFFRCRSKSRKEMVSVARDQVDAALANYFQEV
jgi:hypothetical protein